MSSRYRSLIKVLSPKRLLVLLSGLYLLYFMIGPIYSIHSAELCSDCITIKIPYYSSLLTSSSVIRNLTVKITTLISWLWLHGMVFMFLILERKKIEFEENSDTLDGYELVRVKA